MATAKLESWSDIRELVAMSIGTDKGRWWANPSFGSQLWVLRQEGKVDGNTAGRLRAMVLDALDWLKADGLASEIECNAERAGRDRIEYEVTIHKPQGQAIFVREVWHGITA